MGVGDGEALVTYVGISTLYVDDGCRDSELLGAGVEDSTGEELREVAVPMALVVVCAGKEEVS